MKIVITGGTRGIGFALAKQFLSLNNSVVISGTNMGSVNEALENLKSESVFGHNCRVENYDEVEELYAFAKQKMGEIDIWINNAGINQPKKFFHEMSIEDYKKVINVDIVGLMNGTSVALIEMQKQGHGFIYNMEGLGSDGRIMSGSIVYGMTKRAVRYFTLGVAKENDKSGVNIGRLSPGMVLTDFLLKGLEEDTPENASTKKVFNILADKPEVVTAFLSKKIMKNKKNNAYIAWLTTPKIIFRSLFAFRKKNKFFNIS